MTRQSAWKGIFGERRNEWKIGSWCYAGFRQHGAEFLVEVARGVMPIPTANVERFHSGRVRFERARLAAVPERQTEAASAAAGLRPQGLKADSFPVSIGAAEAAPFQNRPQQL